MVKCREAPLEGERRVKTLSDSLCTMALWELLNTCGWTFVACLLLQLKLRSAKEASHPAFMGNYRTISHTFYSPIYPVDEENEDVGSVWDNISLFFRLVWITLMLWLKTGVRGEYLMCFVSAKITVLAGRLKCQLGNTSWVWYYVSSVVGWLQLPYIRGLVVSTTGSNHRGPVRFPGWQYTSP